MDIKIHSLKKFSQFDVFEKLTDSFEDFSKKSLSVECLKTLDCLIYLTQIQIAPFVQFLITRKDKITILFDSLKNDIRYFDHGIQIQVIYISFKNKIFLKLIF